MSKRIGRRDLINKIKGLRTEVQAVTDRMREAYQMLDVAENRRANEKKDFVKRLERLEGNQDIEYMKGPDSGTLVTTAAIAPEHLKMELRIPKFADVKIENFVRNDVCSALAKALIENGLVRIQMEPDSYGFAKVIARVDVLPWDRICRKNVVVHIDRGGWKA